MKKKQGLKRLFTIGRGSILLSIIGLGLLVIAAGCKQKTAGKAGADAGKASPGMTANTLAVVSPNDEFIRQAFAQGFTQWYAARHDGQQAAIDWQDRGGTVEVINYITSTFGALKNKDEGIGIDLMFGGGAPAFEQLKKAGCTAAANLSSGTLQSIPERLGGVLLRDPGHHWFGTVLSSFGIVYNKPGIKARGLPEPQSWEDLANPAWQASIVLADPAKSGSVRICYEVILEKYGWEKGWGLLTEMAANAREFTANASGVPREVAQGSALGGLCIDFYAYSEIDQAGDATVGFVSPANATAITPDPIGLLRGAPHRALAEDFITFVLSPEGQSLWAVKPGQPGGPPQRGLFRMPILPAAYQRDPATMLIKFNPFATAVTFNLNPAMADRRAPLLGPLFTAAFLSNKDLLQQAGQAARRNPALAAKFEAPPFGEQEALDFAARYQGNSREKAQLDTQWHELFRQRYEQIVNGTAK